MPGESNIRDAADVVKGIVEAVPVYQDVVQPAAKEVGSALQTVAKTIHIALAPISALVWGYDQIKDFMTNKLAEKLINVPPENIASPKPNIAGPAIESLKYTGHEETLSDMYANLLATSIDKRTANNAHPSFVEIIKQLTPDEARLLRILAIPRALPLIDVRADYKVQTETQKGGHVVLSNFSLLGIEAGCDFPLLTPAYIDNLCRLGITELPQFYEYTAKGLYDQLENNIVVATIKKEYETDEKYIISTKRKGLKITTLGKQFFQACVIAHDQNPELAEQVD